jgi:hypothetical protein
VIIFEISYGWVSDCSRGDEGQNQLPKRDEIIEIGRTEKIGPGLIVCLNRNIYDFLYRKLNELSINE